MKQKLYALLAIGIMFCTSSIYAEAPAKPGIDAENDWGTRFENGKLTVCWYMWYGDNGTKAELEVNGNVVDSATLADNTPDQQTGTFEYFTTDQGPFNVRIILSNSFGNNSSDIVQIGGKKSLKLNPMVYSCSTESGKEITLDLTGKITGGMKPYELEVSKQPSNGTVSVSGTALKYTPDKDVLGSDSFTFNVGDSEDGKTGDATVNIEIKKADDPIDLKDLAYYQQKSVREKFRTTDWYTFWQEELNDYGKPFISPEQAKQDFASLNYYVRVDGNIKLDNITETVSDSNPDNVNRVIRLMPKEKYEALFPNTTKMEEVNNFIPGKIYTYKNFLKAVAVMPGYCGDYSSYPAAEKTPEMANPDILAKKFLATTLGHAVQETSNSGSSYDGFKSKLPGTFGHVRESFNSEEEASPYYDASGPFSAKGKLNYLTQGNKYYGRGAKQLSYPSNYANVSLLLYGDLRLVKYPQLVEEDFMPILTAIVYALIPKSGQPSLAEVMDGTWQKKIHDPKNSAPEDFVKRYNRDFPVTVLLVNGGPECGSPISGKDDRTEKDIKMGKANTKTRIDSYNYFSTSEDLLDPDVKYSVDTSEGYDSCMDMHPGEINQNDQPQEYKHLFRKNYYYGPNWENKTVLNYPDNGIQAFGGKAVRKNIKF